MKKITRLQVLEKAKDLYVNDLCHNYSGLCTLLKHSMMSLELYSYKITHRYFPLFTFENAKKFGADGDEYWYWWDSYNWDNGRLDFLNWLIEQYKGDDTNLFELKEQFYLESVELFNNVLY